MATLSAVEQYEARVSTAAKVSIDCLPLELNTTLENRIISFEWTKGTFPASVSALPHVDHLQGLSVCDLRIILAPLDIPERVNSYPGFKRLISLYQIPDHFLEERLHNVAYSFGSKLTNGGLKAAWMHLLFKDVPSNENSDLQEEKAWARTAFFLQWKDCKSQLTETIQKQHPPPTTPDEERPEVTLLCFGAVKHLRERCMQMRVSTNWGGILENPYVLVGYFLDSWYERVDRIVWHANNRGSKLEAQVVKETSAANLSNTRSEVGLEDVYRLVQTVLWLREGLMASLQAIERFIEHYQDSTQSLVKSVEGTNLMANFIYRREMFRASQLRLISLQQRLESINHIVYNLAALRDNRLMHRSSEFNRNVSEAMRQDSSKMATIAWIGIIFLPTSIVATVLSAVYEEGESVAKSVKMLGILLAFSIPITITLVFSYQKLIEPRTQRRISSP